MMRHSTKMREELYLMMDRTDALNSYKHSLLNFPDSYDRFKDVHHEELIGYKVKLEELFEKTDIKEKSMKSDLRCLKIFLF